MDILRTPDERFENLPDYPFEPHYCEVDGLRIHYVDEGPCDAAPVLLLHGEPCWSYVYRKMIPPLVAAGHRVLAPDLVGFGRSDKPARCKDYTYARHVAWLTEWFLAMDLSRVTLFCQDWGGLIGLRVATDHPERFDRIVVANTSLPTGDQKVPLSFKVWRLFSQWVPRCPIGRLIQFACVRPMLTEVRSAHNAPFPNERYKAGPRELPAIVPIRYDDPECVANRRAWGVLEKWDKPFLVAFSDHDPINSFAEPQFRHRIPGAQRFDHPTIRNAGYYVQEDAGEELADIVNHFIAKTS